MNSDYLRFDFSYNKKLESNQILEVENFVNDRINESLELEENRKKVMIMPLRMVLLPFWRKIWRQS